jgi:hypothetical protein
MNQTQREEVSSEQVSLIPLLMHISRYRTAIALAMATVTGAAVLVAIAIYLTVPNDFVTSLDFHLAFRGAERGQYPNGMKFSATEINSPSVLEAVHEKNDLGRYLTFDQFKSAVFVVQSNDALEALSRSYAAKLSDPRLTAVDRERIEREFQDKKDSISQADYSITLVTHDRLFQMPSVLRQKILTDVLSTWADQAVKDKGVSLYDISVLSPGVFDEQATPTVPPVVIADLLRSKIDDVITNIDDLLKLSGAKVVRTRKSGRSLGELRVRLSDLLGYRLKPLVASVVVPESTEEAARTNEFLRTRLRFVQLYMQEGQARVDSVQNALTAYLQQRQQGASTHNSSGGTSYNTTPVIDDSFLDRIVQLSGEASDLQYRQQLVTTLQEESLKVVPAAAEERYYQMLLDRAAATVPTRKLSDANVAAEIKSIRAEAVSATKDVNEIYEQLSKDLNPSTILYSITRPAQTSVRRSVNTSYVILLAVILVLGFAPIIVLATIVYDRTRRSASARQAGSDADGPDSAVAISESPAWNTPTSKNRGAAETAPLAEQ